MPLIAFHVQDPQGRPLGGALITARNQPHGDWAGVTNPCGDFLATLGAGHYDLTITYPGFQARTLSELVPVECEQKFSGLSLRGRSPGAAD